MKRKPKTYNLKLTPLEIEALSIFSAVSAAALCEPDHSEVSWLFTRLCKKARRELGARHNYRLKGANKFLEFAAMLEERKARAGDVAASKIVEVQLPPNTRVLPANGYFS